MNLIFVEKSIFKEEYCTISVLHGTAVSNKLDSTGKVILRYDYIAGILLNTTPHIYTLLMGKPMINCNGEIKI